jgi:hypothetical protein
MILPLVLVLIGDSPPVLLAAVLFLLLGSLAIRFEIIKIPHTLTKPLMSSEINPPARDRSTTMNR